MKIKLDSWTAAIIAVALYELAKYLYNHFMGS